MQLDDNQQKGSSFLTPALFPAPAHSCTGSDLHVLLLAVRLAYADKVFLALWPEGRDDPEVKLGVKGAHAGPRTSQPPGVGGRRGEEQAQLS